ncbi:hypothetical protein RJT34_28883 [Clitoria ternatea]|uniref:H/ACA ribonucleoprotein complex non-core subunit NAF1 n=1 Tax=Clitoria ternatea TaxID=43366 RepID=A0AAN9FFI8_CLITE
MDEFELNDFALADSFINFDYVPPSPSPSPSHPFVIEEAIHKFSSIEIQEKENLNNADDDDTRVQINANQDSDTASSASSSISSEREELEEGEIVDSDDVDDDYYDENPAAQGPVRSRNELEVFLLFVIHRKLNVRLLNDAALATEISMCLDKFLFNKWLSAIGNDESILPPVPAVNVTFEPHHQMLPVGVVKSILGAQVIVEGVEKHNPLNEGSILWMTRTRTPLGLVDEIFGPVKNPYYIVRYNSESEVPKGINGGTLISSVFEFANHVLNDKDLYKKGYDASGVNDEEVSDEIEFSDDEKEAKYKRMLRMTKKSIYDQNPKKENRKKTKVQPKDGLVPTFFVAPPTPVLDHGCSPFTSIGQDFQGTTNTVPLKDSLVPTFPVAPPTSLLDHGCCSPFTSIGQGFQGATNKVPPKDSLVPTVSAALAMSFVDHGHCSPFSGIGQGLCGATTVVPPIAPTNTGPNLTVNGVWKNETTLQLPQSPVFSYGFPVNGVSMCPANTQFSHQLPAPGIPFQQQLNSGHGTPPAATFPGIQFNIYAQLMYALGTVDQNQTTFGLSSPFSQIQPPINLQTNYIPPNQQAPHQFNPGTPAIHGRKPFHRGYRKGWRPAK